MRKKDTLLNNRGSESGSFKSPDSVMKYVFQAETGARSGEHGVVRTRHPAGSIQHWYYRSQTMTLLFLRSQRDQSWTEALQKLEDFSCSVVQFVASWFTFDCLESCVFLPNFS